MQRAIPVHPILLAWFPVLSLYSANLGIFSLADIWVPLVAVTALTATVWGLISFVWRDVRRGAMAASTLAVCCILYSQVFHAPGGVLIVTAWCVVATAGALLVSWKWAGTSLLNVVGVFLILSSVGSIVYRTLHVPRASTAGRLPIVGRSADATSPDIYYIILDGYGRHDSLEQFIDYSNADFLAALRKRGFFVADQSHSNYVQTEISIPSSLNMNFIQTLLPGVNPDDSERASLDRLARTNEADRQFAARGYKTSLVTSGFPIFDRVPADYPYVAKQDRTLFEATLSQSSPLATKRADDAMYQQRRDQLLQAFASIKRMAGRRAKPRFVFVHVLAPHPPFVFDAKGRPIRPPYAFGLWDGSDFMISGMKSADYQKGYAGLVQTVNRLVLDAVDALLAKPGVRPIIILQGDHGSKRFLDQNDLSKTDVRECFSNLCAVLAPPSVEKALYPSITPVNELRCVLNGLFDAKLPLLADKSWYSPYNYPYRFADVTDSVVKYADRSGSTRHPSPDPEGVKQR